MTTKQAAIYRRMRPFERLRVALGLHEFARRRLSAAIRGEHPHLTERELQEAVLRRFIGEPGTVLRRSADGA